MRLHMQREMSSRKTQAAAVDWASWLDEHGSRLLLFARQQCRRDADAEDVMQEALVQLVQVVESGDFQGDASGWLSYAFTAVRHLAADRGRRESVRQEYARTQQEVISEGEEETPWLSCAADDDYLRRRIEKLLRTLPKESAEVVVLKIWGEHTFQQIADMTHTKLATVASRYRYAMQALRKELEADPIE